MFLEFFLRLSDWRTRWGPRVSESPVEDVGNFVLPILYTLLMLALLRECSCFLSFRTSSHGCFRCIKSSCITRLTQSRVRSGCTPLHHEQNPYKIQTAPGYYYKADELLRCFNKITTLQTSSLDVPPLQHEQNPSKIQTAPGYYYKADELLRCFNKIRTFQTSFFFLSPIRTWTAVRDQESVNQESEIGIKQECVRRGSSNLMAGKVVFLRGLLNPIRVVDLM
ncbi:hypothetical protein TNCV_3040731, partial [Trichonephila clavipes]